MLENAAITFMDKYIPDTMAPLDCMDSILELEVGFGTLEETLTQCWAPLMRENEILKVSAKFWPSDALMEKLLTCDEPFAVTTEDGMLLANRGQETTPVLFTCDNDSLFLRYPWDLLRLNELVLASVRENKLEGNVRELAVLDGIVHLGEGSELLPGVYVEGVAMIGKNCKIGPNCYLRGLNYIGSNCHIGQTVEVKNSILMSNVKAGHLSYIGDSVICSDVNIGAGTITSNLRHDGKKQRSVVNGTLVDTGRRKLGAIIGKDVHTGIHTSIYPGRKIWSGMDTRPGDIIQQDLRNAPEGD